jgi:hypothetical protein
VNAGNMKLRQYNDPDIGWSDEQTEALKRMSAEGHGPSAISKAIGKTVAAVTHKSIRLGLPRPSMIDDIMWPQDIVDIMMKMHAEQRTYGQIAKAIGKTRAAVCGKAFRMGLANIGDRHTAQMQSMRMLVLWEQRREAAGKSRLSSEEYRAQEEEKRRARRAAEAAKKAANKAIPLPKKAKPVMQFEPPKAVLRPSMDPDRVERGDFAKPMEQQERGECSWPMGKRPDGVWMYCCAPTGGPKYCSVHHEIATAKRPPPSQRSHKRKDPLALPEPKINF